MLHRRIFLALLFPFIFSSMELQASETDYTTSQSDFGGVGLLQLPTGRMEQEGAFHLNAAFNPEYYRYSVSIQLFDWMESTIRYTDTQTQQYSDDPTFSDDTTHKDKGIDFKLRLLKESYWLPETSIGFRDIGGTGLFDSEFIAANKRFGHWDFTLGLGWGYMAKSGNVANPFCKLKESYCERPGGFSGNGGNIDFDRFFKGDAALFAGVEYQTAHEPLTLKLEYDTNNYQDDFAGSLPQDSRFNFGAVYRLGDWGSINFSYQRGNTFSLGFTIGSQFNHLPSVWLDEPKPSLTYKAPTSPGEWRQLAGQLEKNAGYRAPTIYQSENSLTLVGEQKKYRDRSEAEERAATLMLGAAGGEIQTLKIIETSSHVAMTQVEINRYTFESHVLAKSLHSKTEDSVTSMEPERPIGDVKFKADDRLYYGLSPVVSQSFGGAESDLFYSLGIKGSSGYWLTDQLQVQGALYLSLLNNYDQYNYVVPPDGTDELRVRTLIRDYTDQPFNLNNLQLTWIDNLAPNLYGQLYGGYLELMFGGIGGELLYRPQGSRWALGLDLNYVSQRDPDSPLGFFDQELQYSPKDEEYYRVARHQTTGHLSFYYRPDWGVLDNTLIKISAGRYLAGDHGMTLDFSKQFKSGVIVGAYASKTDMSVEEFGEGSFTKGFYISIPFDVMTIKPSTSRALIGWQPLTRDGGQKLSRDSELYEVTDPRSPWYTKAKQYD